MRKFTRRNFLKGSAAGAAILGAAATFGTSVFADEETAEEGAGHELCVAV